MALVQEAYSSYTPPRWVRPTVERLLAGVPAAHLSGVQAIVLTDAAGQTEFPSTIKGTASRCGAILALQSFVTGRFTPTRNDRFSSRWQEENLRDDS
jgi:hypothetical protein